MSRSRTGSHQSHHTAAGKHTNMEEVQKLVKYKYKVGVIDSIIKIAKSRGILFHLKTKWFSPMLGPHDSYGRSISY